MPQTLDRIAEGGLHSNLVPEALTMLQRSISFIVQEVGHERTIAELERCISAVEADMLRHMREFVTQ